MSVIQAASIGVLIGLLASGGQLCLAMIRAERGRDGVVVVHRSQDMIGRTISLCFAAPIYFHIVRLQFTEGGLKLF